MVARCLPRFPHRRRAAACFEATPCARCGSTRGGIGTARMKARRPTRAGRATGCTHTCTARRAKRQRRLLVSSRAQARLQNFARRGMGGDRSGAFEKNGRRRRARRRAAPAASSFSLSHQARGLSDARIILGGSAQSSSRSRRARLSPFLADGPREPRRSPRPSPSIRFPVTRSRPAPPSARLIPDWTPKSVTFNIAATASFIGGGDVDLNDATYFLTFVGVRNGPPRACQTRA